MPEAVYLGLDIGTSSAKCLAVDERGDVIGISQESYPVSHPRDNWAEQNPEDYWRAVTHVIRRCVLEAEKNGAPVSAVISMAMSTQADTLLVVSRDGEPLLPAISWMDTRGHDECAELLSEAGQDFWHAKTGQMLTPYSSACSIRWLQKHLPERLAGARFCYVPDWLAYKLCGKFAADMPSASWSPYCSAIERQISQAVLDLLGVEAGLFADVYESGESIGTLSKEVAGLLGLPEDVKLVAGAFDQTAAAHGSGASVGGRSVLSCGTAWVLYSVFDNPQMGNVNIMGCCHVRPDEWGVVMPFTGGAAYDWLHKTFGQKRSQMESSVEPLVFIPHLYGGLSPDWKGNNRGTLFGLTLAHGWNDIEYAMMRGMAFEVRRNVEATENSCGKIASLRMVGGAGKSDVWPQIIANAINIPVDVADMTESACYGAAMIAAGGVSVSWNGIQSVRVYRPDAEGVSVEQKNYEQYLKYYTAVCSLYE